MMEIDKGGKSENTILNDESDTSKRQKLKERWIDFGENTSMHGLGRAVGSRLVIKRIFWSLVVLGFAAYAVRNLISIFQEFSAYPVSTTVGEEYESRMPFPAVTICNQNLIMKSKAPTKISDTLDHLQQSGAEVEWLHLEAELLLKQYQESYRKSIAHQLKEMLLRCTFDGIDCFSYNFTESYNRKFGNCFTFNYNNINQKYTVLPGPNSGLKLELDIQTDEYLSMTPSSGIKLVIHPQNYMAFPEEEGLVVSPGFSTSIGMKKVEITRSPPPYGQCVDVEEANKNSKLNMFYTYSGASYSDKVCKKTCYQTQVYTHCRCCDQAYPCMDDALVKNTGVVVNTPSIPFCNTSYSSSHVTVECLARLQASYMEGNLTCLSECKPACEETRYTERLSMSKWPREDYYDNIIDHINELSPSSHLFFNDIAEKREFIDKNLVRMEIFYESLNFETIVTTPAYDGNRLLSDVGGQLGLWLGFSVMTALEWLEFVMDSLIFICRKLSRKSSKTTPVKPFK